MGRNTLFEREILRLRLRMTEFPAARELLRIRLIRALQEGDPSAIYVPAFAVVGTIVLVLIAELVQRRRKGKTHKSNPD